MSNLLEITGDDIALLNDADLRSLIGRLCEADYRIAGLSTKGITWGGHQDAPDGGLDVVVRTKEVPPKTSYIPKRTTGFQVKASDMPNGKILKEMRVAGDLREEINGLIKEKGAYVIVSSRGSVTETALKSRINAMRDAIVGEKGIKGFTLDFLDRGQIATWVRSHQSMILWVRNKIGRELKGWQSYDNWAYAPGGIEEEYLLDDSLRLHDNTQPMDAGLSIEDGLRRLRIRLSTQRACVRLTGLSGVGKTRLVQALFDERISTTALNRFQVCYTDMSHGPNPDPKSFAHQLVAEKSSVILVVDNCPPELHRTLVKVCSGSNSKIKLLTIEYDVREDHPEETSVFKLEPASERLLQNLIRHRYSYISQIDSRTIAAFSGGNARVAIALADTMKIGETLSTLRDEELFERLFKQRKDSSENLKVSAEVCSLVYSFDGEDTDSETSEIKFLASLINKPPHELYR